MQTLWQDLKYALRTLRKSPGFTTIAVLTLAIGVALNASMFSLASAWLLRRPPVHDPDTIVVVFIHESTAGVFFGYCPCFRARTISRSAPESILSIP